MRSALFTQIHEIVFHGKGGYDWNTVYEMPRWLRQFTFNKIQDFYNKEAEAQENAASSNKNTLIDPSGNVNRENWKGIPTPIQPGKSDNKVKYK
jgi:hypothetical protein